MQTEIVVIGSGVAATALVTKILASRPHTAITVLEAGGKIKMRDFALYQNYLITNKLPFDSQNIYDSCHDLSYPDRDRPGENKFEGDTEIPMTGARAFLYGGSTVHWGGWAFRLKPEDFHLRTSLENKGIVPGDVIDWPIDYPEMEPYYHEAEHFIGVSGDSEDTTTPRSGKYPFQAFPFTLEDGLFIDAFKKFAEPVSYSHLPIARYGDTHANNSHGPCHTTGLCKYCPFGARFVAANNLDDLVQSARYPHLQVLMHVIADEILMDSKSHATGVKYFNKKKGAWETVEATIIINAAGAIEGPKLLQRSALNWWKNGIGNDNDLVGRFLISHPYFFFKAVLPGNPQMLQPEMGFPTLVSRHYDSPAEQHKGKFVLINPPTSPKVNLVRSVTSGKTRADIIQSIQTNTTVQLQGMVEVFSDRRNRVENTEKKNRFGMKETKITFSKSKDFDNRMQEVSAIAETIFGHMNAVSPGIENPISWRADHAACTTRMSLTPEDGVVDRDLRVHGTSNIYMCSNAVFSSLGAVNPTLTLTALSLRLGSHLLNQLKD
ncbi:GMC oxidoreductase [Chitinophaga varians]|uniref:GMC oxidoreductase n=1 Tax=Chitinophaga varians TaxID=2202339 RepID=UPI00165F9EF0|nr:GMC family oxidoreductase [Chitinophaga varians]MBC9909757.1 GMC family oxidoreductase [Chitinophaga varians]